MKNSAFRKLAAALLLPLCVGCQTAGSVFRDSVDLMATPAAWIGNASGSKNSPNSDQWTSGQWGPKN
jgi:hypothetical protein